MKNRLKRGAGFFKALPAGIRQAQKGGDYNASFRAMWEHFLNSIIHDKPVECTLEDGRKSLQIALAAAESASTEKTIFVSEASRSVTLF
jgi:predicted dehydrogenase